MKIGFDAKRFFFNHSGLGNYSRRLIESLFQYFPEHEYVLYSDRLDTFEKAHPEALRILEHYGNSKTSGADLYTLVMVDAPKWWRVWGLGKRAATDGVDVFHGLSNELPWDLPPAVKSVCTIHDVIFKQFPSYYRWWDRWIYDAKTRRATKMASHLVMTSEATKNQVERFYPIAKGKSSVIYQAVDATYYQQSISSQRNTEDEDVPYFVYHSSFTDRKNHAALIEAFAKIQKQTHWNLKLVGLKGPTLAIVEHLIEQLGLNHRIACLVDLPTESMVEVVKSASAFVYPSLNEGFGIPLAESLAANLPMAVSRIPVFQELVEDMPAYFHPNDTDEMAAAMMSITQAETQAQQRLKRDGLLKKVEAQSIAKQCVELYQNVCAGH